MIARALPVTVVLVSLAGCGGAPGACGPGGADAARMQLLATEVEVARRAETGPPAEAFAQVFTADAVFLPMNYPALYGRDDIVTFLGDAGLRMSWTPAGAEVSEGCDIGYTYGAWEAWTEADDSATPGFSGKYLGTWRHDPDTGWRLAVYMQNSDPAPTTPAGPPGADD